MAENNIKEQRAKLYGTASERNLADLLTNSLGKASFLKSCKELGVMTFPECSKWEGIDLIAKNVNVLRGMP